MKIYGVSDYGIGSGQLHEGGARHIRRLRKVARRAGKKACEENT